MTDYSDVVRARLGARMAIGRQTAFRAPVAERGDASLYSLLEKVRCDKSAQTTRLMRWLEAHDVDLNETRNRNTVPGNDSREIDSGHDTQFALNPESASEDHAEASPAAIAGSVAVTGVTHLSPELIRFRVSRPPDFDFRAGQSVKVGLDDIQRSYSIVSAPHESFLEFFVELTPGGRMSEALRNLSVGDRVSLGSAKGGFRFNETCPEQVMIATVTGINPFVSMLRDYLYQKRRGHRFHVLQGASHKGELGYHDELSSLAAANPDVVRYLPTVSRPEAPANAGWNGQTGRVDAVIGDYLEQYGLRPETTEIYVCGHSGMIDNVASHYRAARFSVRTESYD